jgi:hypothetical protein
MVARGHLDEVLAFCLGLFIFLLLLFHWFPVQNYEEVLSSG